MPDNEQTLQAIVRDAGGNVMARGVSWSTSNAAVATVDGNGKVTSVGVGTAIITATTSEGFTDTSTVTVLKRVASVVVTPNPTAIAPNGGAVQFTATPYDAQANPLTLTNRTVSWASSDTDKVTVTSTGLATGGQPGPATITATVDGVQGTAAVTVQPATSATDEFARANGALGTLPTGQTWQFSGDATWAIEDGKARVTANQRGWAFVTTSSANGTLTMEVTDGDKDVGLVFRQQDVNNKWAVFWDNGWRLFRIVSSVFQEQKVNSEVPRTAGDVLSVILDGDRMIAKVNDWPLFDLADASFNTAVVHGMTAGQATSRVERWAFDPAISSLLAKYVPGDNIARKGGTFTRSSVALYVGTDGLYREAAANVLRDAHYIGGTRTTLIEAEGKTNYTPYATDASNALWSAGGLTKTTDYNVEGPSVAIASASAMVRETSGVFEQHYVNIGNGFNAPGNEWCLQLHVKPRFGARYCSLRTFESGTFVTKRTVFDCSGAGAIVAGFNNHLTGTDQRAFIQAMGDGWYRIGVRAEYGNVSGHEGFVFGTADSGAGANYDNAYIGDGTRAWSLWGAQNESGRFWSSLIPNLTGTAVSRAADVLNFKWHSSPNLHFTMYHASKEVGGWMTPDPNGPAFAERTALRIGEDYTAPYLTMGMLINSAPVNAINHHANLTAGGGGGSQPSMTGKNIAMGDTVEDAISLRADGSYLPRNAVRSEAETVGTASNTGTLATDSWTVKLMQVGMSGGRPANLAFTKIAVARGDQTIPQMRAF